MLRDLCLSVSATWIRTADACRLCIYSVSMKSHEGASGEHHVPKALILLCGTVEDFRRLLPSFLHHTDVSLLFFFFFSFHDFSGQSRTCLLNHKNISVSISMSTRAEQIAAQMTDEPVTCSSASQLVS